MSIAHLHIHTHYSCDDSIVKIPELFERASTLGLSGIAIADPSRMCGVPEFLSCSRKYPEIKPIVGCEFNLTNHIPHTENDVENMQLFSVVLLAKNLAGYHNLLKLSSIANTEGLSFQPRISHQLLEQYHEGLICLSGGLGGEVSQAIIDSSIVKARKVATWYKGVFGDDFYLEMSLHKRERDLSVSVFDNYMKLYADIDELYVIEKKVAARLFRLGQELGIKLVGTNPVLFLNRDDAVAHDAYYCHRIGQRMSDDDRPRFSHLEYLRSEEEMRKVFAKYPEAVDNTLEILGKIERYEIYRNLTMPTVSDDAKQELRDTVYHGVEERYGTISAPLNERIEFELSTISKIGFDSYFLIIKELTDWARKNNYVVGPGRGSATGSIVNYCLGITDVDPIKFGLLFERFLNPERIQLPDIDIDFNAAGLDKIAAHLADKYGQECVSHVICFYKNRATDAFETSARAYGVQAGKISRIKGLISDWSPRGLEEELVDNRKLQHEYKVSTPRSQEAYQTAQKLEGVISRTGVHACANLVSSSLLTECIPMMSASIRSVSKRRGERVVPLSQYDVCWAEDAGVLKIDTLGLLTLDILREAEALISMKHDIKICLHDIPLDDIATYELYQTGNTDDIFQFESEGMKAWLNRIHPESFSHLVALYSMYRPGPMDFLPDYALRKNGVEPVSYVIPETESILSETYGLILYQEQVMMIAQKIANFTPGQSDKLRKVAGSMKPAAYHLASHFKDLFIAGGVKNGYGYASLEKLWQIIDHNGHNAFLKSHAVAYTWLSYQTAWFKAHYPDEYSQSVAKVNKAFGR